LDDDEIFQFYLKHQLKNKGFKNTSTFSDSASIMDRVKDNPDVIILDYHLNNENGSNALTFYKKHNPETKVIMLSSQSDIEIALELLEKGADEYIIKAEDNWLNYLYNYLGIDEN